MSDPRQLPLSEITVDAENLYREEIFTDLKVGTLRRYTPIKSDGSADESRTPVFAGETQLMSQAGPVPVNCSIPANSLEEAIAGFPSAIQKAVERMMEEVREMQKREASRIVVPGQEGRGKIELP